MQNPIPCQKLVYCVAALCCVILSASAQSRPPAADAVQSGLEKEYASLLDFYKDLHLHPELSLHEERTSAHVAEELKKAGYEVTTKVGGHGVVAFLRNGAGRTVLVRTDMDALPVKEQTGLPYASSVTSKDARGNDVPVMHACGHDMNMTCVIGAARQLAQVKDRWHGTLVVIGQPAEETGQGARAMLADGLFSRFPRPDFCLALHDDAELAAGTVGYTPGFTYANVDMVDITIHGIGGHMLEPKADPGRPAESRKGIRAMWRKRGNGDGGSKITL